MPGRAPCSRHSDAARRDTPPRASGGSWSWPGAPFAGGAWRGRGPRRGGAGGELRGKQVVGMWQAAGGQEEGPAAGWEACLGVPGVAGGWRAAGGAPGRPGMPGAMAGLPGSPALCPARSGPAWIDRAPCPLCNPSLALRAIRQLTLQQFAWSAALQTFLFAPQSTRPT